MLLCDNVRCETTTIAKGCPNVRPTHQGPCVTDGGGSGGGGCGFGHWVSVARRQAVWTMRAKGVAPNDSGLGEPIRAATEIARPTQRRNHRGRQRTPVPRHRPTGQRRDRSFTWRLPVRRGLGSHRSHRVRHHPLDKQKASDGPAERIALCPTSASDATPARASSAARSALRARRRASTSSRTASGQR